MRGYILEEGPAILQFPGSVTPRSRTRVRMPPGAARPKAPLVGPEQEVSEDFPNWDRDRPPVVYHLQIWHRYDGSFSFWIKDADNDPDSLRSIASVLRGAADHIDPDFTEKKA
jgi:hypothetical protein